MKKSQALVIQFVMFVGIGLAFFLAAANLIRLQSDFIKGDILSAASDLAVEQMSANSIIAVSSCKSCDQVSLRFEVERITDYSPNVGFDADLTLSIEPENKVVRSSMHNLKHSVQLQPSTVSAIRPVILTYEKLKNNLVVS